jgi:hypothetical protein
MPDYADFRQRLDAVLRTLDVQRVREFLIAEKQWSSGTPADPEFAMWTMIAGSPSLRDLHGRAIEWLAAHGHAEEAQLFQARQSRPAGKAAGKSGKGGGSRKHTGGKRGKA